MGEHLVVDIHLAVQRTFALTPWRGGDRGGQGPPWILEGEVGTFVVGPAGLEEAATLRFFWLPHFADRSPPEPIRSSDPYPCVDRDPSFPFPPLPPLRSKYQGPKTQVAATCAGLVVSNYTVLSHAVRMTRKEPTSLAGCYIHEGTFHFDNEGKGNDVHQSKNSRRKDGPGFIYRGVSGVSSGTWEKRWWVLQF